MIKAKKTLSTFEREMQNFTFKKKFEKSYKNFLFSELAIKNLSQRLRQIRL